MNVKRWLNDWSAEICFLSIFASAVLIFGFVIWQSEKYKNGGFVKDDTVWYSATIVIHYPDKADSINIRTCRVPYVRVGRGWNSLNYTDPLGYHYIKSIAPIEIVDIVKIEQSRYEEERILRIYTADLPKETNVHVNRNSL